MNENGMLSVCIYDPNKIILVEDIPNFLSKIDYITEEKSLESYDLIFIIGKVEEFKKIEKQDITIQIVENTYDRNENFNSTIVIEKSTSNDYLEPIIEILEMILIPTYMASNIYDVKYYFKQQHNGLMYYKTIIYEDCNSLKKELPQNLDMAFLMFKIGHNGSLYIISDTIMCYEDSLQNKDAEIFFNAIGVESECEIYCISSIYKKK